MKVQFILGKVTADLGQRAVQVADQVSDLVPGETVLYSLCLTLTKTYC